MKAILVDDERLALSHLELLLREIGGVEIVGQYQDPRQALEAALAHKPDVVFLDVEMPEISGIEVAEKLQSALPDVRIIFVTAYDEYAVKAFELHALDYILKPPRRERLTKTMQRLMGQRLAAPQLSVRIRSFQSLQIESGPPDAPQIVEVRWRTNKAQELFAYLLHHRGKAVRKDVLLDLLWPDVDWKKGFTQLYTTVYQIRKMLTAAGVDVAIKSYEEGYLLDLQQVRLDVDEWESGLRKAPPLTEANLPIHISLLEEYRGDYLADYDYLWAENERQRLRTIWTQHAMQIGDYFVSNRDYMNAIGLYHRIQRIHPYMENIYFSLMQLYEELGDRSSVERQYESLKTMLSTEYDAEPQPEINEWYQAWKEGQAQKLEEHRSN